MTKTGDGKRYQTKKIAWMFVLVVELAVLVPSKERLSDRGKGVDLEQPQTLLEGVVDFDFALAADNEYTTGTKFTVSKLFTENGQGNLRFIR